MNVGSPTPESAAHPPPRRGRAGTRAPPRSRGRRTSGRSPEPRLVGHLRAGMGPLMSISVAPVGTARAQRRDRCQATTTSTRRIVPWPCRSRTAAMLSNRPALRPPKPRESRVGLVGRSECFRSPSPGASVLTMAPDELQPRSPLCSRYCSNEETERRNLHMRCRYDPLADEALPGISGAASDSWSLRGEEAGAPRGGT